MTEFAYKVGPLIFGSNVELPYVVVPVQLKTAEILVVDLLPEPPSPNGEHLHEVVDNRGVWHFSGGVASALVFSEKLAHICRNGVGSDLSGLTTIVLRIMLALGDVVLLHGSAVAKNDGAWVWFGESGSGKSTTAAREALEGALHLNDDVVPLCFNSEGQVCTFQCDRSASLLVEQNGSVCGLGEGLLPQSSHGRRSDGKSLYRLSPASSELYPVEFLGHLTRQGALSGYEVSSSECVRLLLQSTLGHRLIPNKPPRKHITLIAALVQQLASRESSQLGTLAVN